MQTVSTVLSIGLVLGMSYSSCPLLLMGISDVLYRKASVEVAFCMLIPGYDISDGHSKVFGILFCS